MAKENSPEKNGFIVGKVFKAVKGAVVVGHPSVNQDEENATTTNEENAEVTADGRSRIFKMSTRAKASETHDGIKGGTVGHVKALPITVHITGNINVLRFPEVGA